MNGIIRALRWMVFVAGDYRTVCAARREPAVVASKAPPGLAKNPHAGHFLPAATVSPGQLSSQERERFRDPSPLCEE